MRVAEGVYVLSEITSVDDTLVDSSTPIADEVYVHEDDQDNQESEVESIVATTPSISSSSESVALFLPVAYDETPREIAIGDDDYKFTTFPHSIL